MDKLSLLPHTIPPLPEASLGWVANTRHPAASSAPRGKAHAGYLPCRAFLREAGSLPPQESSLHLLGPVTRWMGAPGKRRRDGSFKGENTVSRNAPSASLGRVPPPGTSSGFHPSVQLPLPLPFPTAPEPSAPAFRDVSYSTHGSKWV